MAVAHQPKSKKTAEKLRRGIERNRTALHGKMALYATLEQMGKGHSEEADALIRRIQRLRCYVRNATGDDE